MADVNKPTDVKQKEADISRKLQVYGIFQAFQTGKVPSNDQIDVALNSFLASRALANPSKKLSAEGQALIGDVRDVVEEAKRLVLSKNEGNLLQDFIWQTTHFDPASTPTPGAPVDKATAKEHGDAALQGLRTLGTLIVTNGQFRKLLSDAIVLVKDMTGDAASHAASKVRPSEEALANIDAPAQDHTWHEKPNISKDNMKKQIQSAYQSATPGNGGANSKLPEREGAAASAPMDPGAAADAVAGPEAREAAKRKAREQRARAREYLRSKMPSERQDQTIWRLKKMVLECQQHPDYQQAIQTLLDLAREYGGHAKTLTAAGTGTVDTARSNLARAEADLKTLMERCANGTSTDSLWDSIGVLYSDAEKDPELRNWFRATYDYVCRCLQEEGYVLDDSSTQEWNRLYDRGQYLLGDKYKAHTDQVVDETKFLLDQFDQDPQNQALAASLKKLFRSLGNDENGKPTFKRHLVKDLSDVIIPAIFENVAYIPIPRIEYTDPTIDAVIENLVLESDNFMPNLLEVASENNFRWGRKTVRSKSSHAFDVTVAGVQLDLRGVAYHIKRKTGLLKLTDSGTADLVLAKEGLTFRLKMTTTSDKDAQNFFRVDKVDVNVKHLKVTLTKSKHKLLFNLFRPVLLGAMRPALQKAAENAIKDSLAKLDNLLFQIKTEADRALEEASSNPEDLPNIYSRYLDAAKKQMLQGKKKAEAVVEDKKVNYAITQEDTMFPDVKLEGGISAQATEFKEQAKKGDKWESPVFSIGTAPASKNIPPPPQIVKKSHVRAPPTNVGSGMNGGRAAPLAADNFQSAGTGYGRM